MSDQNAYYASGSRRLQIRNFVLSEMMRGAGWGASVVLGIVLLLWVVYLLGLFLPEQSKNAPPPMPFSALVAPATTA